MKIIIAFLLTAFLSTAVYAIGQSAYTNASNGYLAVAGFFVVWLTILFAPVTGKGKLK